MNKSLKNMIFLSVLMAATVCSAMRAADKNVIENVASKSWSWFRPSTWGRKPIVVKSVEVAPKKPKFLVPLIKSFAKRTFYSGVAAAGCYWFANSPALESLLRMGGHDASASRIADPLTKTLVGAVVGAVIYRQASQFKREVIGGITDSETLNKWIEDRIGKGIAIYSGSMTSESKNNLEEIVTNAGVKILTEKPGCVSIPVYQSGATAQDMQNALQIELEKHEQKLKQGLIDPNKLDRVLELLDRKPLYMRVWNWVFKKRGSSKKPVNPSVMPGSGTSTSTDTTKPEDKNQPSKINKE